MYFHSISETLRNFKYVGKLGHFAQRISGINYLCIRRSFLLSFMPKFVNFFSLGPWILKGGRVMHKILAQRQDTHGTYLVYIKEGWNRIGVLFDQEGALQDLSDQPQGPTPPQKKTPQDLLKILRHKDFFLSFLFTYLGPLSTRIERLKKFYWPRVFCFYHIFIPSTLLLNSSWEVELEWVTMAHIILY